MEFLNVNLINTTTQIELLGGGLTAGGSGTATAKYLFNRDKIFQYQTSGMNDDNTTASIVINFDATTTIDRLVLREMNWKDFTVFYNGATANTFDITSTGSTTTTDFSTNSETSMFIKVDSVDVTSVTFDISSTIVADSEKAVGEIVLSTKRLVFPRLPSSREYKPVFDFEQKEHRLSDGGTRIHNIQSKFSANISYQNITESFRDSLLDVYEDQETVIFAEWETMTGWNEVFFEAVWSGPFDFYKYSDNATEAGYSGTIRLKETPI